jgi:long-chain acyl-CoA synthetase
VNPKQIIADTFQRNQARTFLIDAQTGRELSYGDVQNSATALANELALLGAAQGHRIAMILPNSWEFAVLYFACFQLGAVATPINPQLRQSDTDFILENSGARLVLCSFGNWDQSGFERLKATGTNFIAVKIEAEGDKPPPADGQRLEPVHSLGKTASADWCGSDYDEEELLSLTFTSGTTARPKGVAHSYRSMFGCAMAFNQLLGFGTESRLLHVFSMAYMAGFFNTLICPFLAGGSVILVGTFSPATALGFWKPAKQYGANALWLAPTMMAALIKLDRDPSGIEYCTQSIKTVCVGTAPLPHATKEAFEGKYGVEAFESYGLSELLIITTNSRHSSREAGSVGQLLPGAEVISIDEDWNKLPQDHNGDLLVRTPFALSGYLDYDSGEIEAFDQTSWFDTGDVGILRGTGELFITDRKKDVIVRGGVNVSPRAIEEALIAHEVVDQQAAVIALPHEFYGEEVVAFVKLRANVLPDDGISALKGFCREQFSAAEQPSRYFVVDQFPVNATGKIQKSELKANALAEQSQ